MDTDPVRVAARGQLTMSDAAWEQARNRAAVIGSLAALGATGIAAADTAAAELGVSRRQVYMLLDRYRQGSGLVTDLAVRRSTGGKGGKRLPESVEEIIRDLIRKRFLTRQKRSVAALHREIARACAARGLKAPTRNTVARRISMLNPVDVGRRREGADAVRPLQSAGGDVPVIGSILDQVQIDHTVIDVIIVDERERRSIGRPYLTVAIDVYSRTLVGMVVTLEPPSAVSVGLCLAHAAADKRPWLERLGVEADWPMSGKPKLLFLDNAAEFKSEALRRGCEQHGIGLAYRPPGRPHYGGIVERVIGTAMRQIHELPGTTFSNPVERGRYDSEKLAALTLPELEKWVVLAVAGYHGSVHSTLGQTPAGRVGCRCRRRRHPFCHGEPDGVPGGFSSGHSPRPDPYRFCHRPRPLLRECLEALDRPARRLGAIHHPAGSARYQPGLGVGAGRPSLCGSPVQVDLEPCRQRVGTPAGAGQITRTRCRPGG